MPEIITKYFPNLTPKQREQFDRLQALYAEWNEKINVVSRKDIEQLYERHVLHSLAIAKVIQFAPGTRVLDVGTGGGFPGIPLAILFPETNFTLVDSIGKKIKVVQGVAEALGLENVTALNQRAETVPGMFDFVVSRAVTRFTPFYGWIRDKISKNNSNALPNGVLYLKGGDLRTEMNELTQANKGLKNKTYLLSDFFTEEFFETKAVIHAWKGK